MMRKLVLGLCLSFAFSVCMAGQVIELNVGEIKILKVGKVERVAVGKGGMLSTSLLKNGQLILIAEQEGVTTLHIWYKNGRETDMTVQIDTANVKEIKRLGSIDARSMEVRQLLSDISGLQVRVIGERIILSGRIDKSYQAVLKTVQGVYTEIMDLTRKEALNLPNHKMVLMNIKITEFNRNYLETLGIRWDNPISGPAAAFSFDAINNDFFRVTPPTPSFSGLPIRESSPQGFFGIATEISSRINFAINSGNALILASPRLVARSGGEAQFLAGGEIPLPVTNSLGSSNVEFKEFGITLTIKPEIDQNDNIQANVSTEVSTIDPANAVQGIPGFRTRKTTADISVRPGETLVLSGLVDQQTSKSVDRLKFLGDLPVLGALFRSKEYRDNKSELVIFVSPTIHDASAPLNKAYLERNKSNLEEFRKAVKEPGLKILD